MAPAPVFRGGPDRRLTIAAVTLALLLALTSVMVLLGWRHESKIGRLQAEMSTFLSKHDEATFEEIFKNLNEMEEGDAREALLKSTENGSIVHDQKEFSIGGGKVLEVRFYRL